MKTRLHLLLVTLSALVVLPGVSAAQESLGRVKAIYVAQSANILIDPRLQPQRQGAHLVAEVVERNEDGTPGRTRFARLGEHAVEVGDVLAISGETVLPSPARRLEPRVMRIEAKRHEELARQFFRLPSAPLDVAQAR
ncbi:MAG: hypothetical protein JNM79_09480 [Burkholderiales bacterium]|nr:hypothetical protein [Burkholderiales bacterium]